jgi:nucleotide-binding universal stress UspA family protein
MATLTLVCTDGSDLADNAAAAGLQVLAPADRTVIVTVVPEPSLMLPYDASGMAGAAVSPAEFDEIRDRLSTEGQSVLERTARELGIDNAETRVLVGDAGRGIVELAAELEASVIVLGSRGRGGLVRAVLGSVSDHVVRHAPCPVLVTHSS